MTTPITLVPREGLRRFRDEFRAFFMEPLVAPDPSLPPRDTIYPLLISECGDPTALCSVCRVLTLDAPARADCESCARGAA